jgi:predicted nucleic acid-binding protein
MREKLFVDTWGWIVILNKREPLHQEINDLYKRVRHEGWTICTTDYVLDETWTLLFRRLPSAVAIKAMSIINDAISQGYLAIEWISPERFERAKELRLRLRDKSEMSFTDLTSMAVMKELGLKAALTNDDHFIHVGMGFKKMP